MRLNKEVFFLWKYNQTTTSDELYHWKYVKKKKVNGKWRYYYDIKDALGYTKRDKLDKAIEEYNKADKKASELEKRDRKKYRKNGSMVSNDTAEARIYASDKAREVKKAQVKYKKTPLGKLDSLGYQIEKGAKAVDKLFNKRKK